MHPERLSMMPEGFDALGAQKLKDVLMFLTTPGE